ncbi:MAG: 50S ribosomal protein L25 [Limisphaerales bacterium]
MKTVTLNAFPRTFLKRPAVKKLRATGRVPAVIYGKQTKPQTVEINTKEIENVIHHAASENVLLDLSLEGGKRLALVQEIQHHALSGKILHVDLHEVAENEKVTIQVPIESVGEAVGVKTGGGVLEHVLFKIKVRALPKDLPEVIYVDVTHLEIGKSIHLGDLQAPERVEIIGNKEISVLAVAAPLTEAQEIAATEAAAGAAGEVEMLKEKKEEGAEEAVPAKGAEKGAEKGAGGEKAGGKGDDKKADKKK